MYTWTWDYLREQLHINVPQPVSQVTRLQLSKAVDVIAGLTMMYGP